MYCAVNGRSVKSKKRLERPIMRSDFFLFDPRGQPTVTIGNGHYFQKWCPSVRTFQNIANLSSLIVTGGTVGLAKEIIDDFFLLKTLFCLQEFLEMTTRVRKSGNSFLTS